MEHELLNAGRVNARDAFHWTAAGIMRRCGALLPAEPFIDIRLFDHVSGCRLGATIREAPKPVYLVPAMGES